LRLPERCSSHFLRIGTGSKNPSRRFDLDFHTVPANTQKEPLEKHYISRRSRSQQGVL